jgi:hypothetical protein
MILEVTFEEMNKEQYAQLFAQVLKDHFRRELSEDQLSLLDQAIEESRLAGQAPVDLAENLNDNWEIIFPS